MRDLLHAAADHAADYLEGVDERPVHATASYAACLEALGGPMPEGPAEPGQVPPCWSTTRRGSRASSATSSHSNASREKPSATTLGSNGEREAAVRTAYPAATAPAASASEAASQGLPETDTTEEADT